MARLGEETRPREPWNRGACPRCGFIGPRHLCGCMAKIGEALDDADLPAARKAYRELVAAAKAGEIRRQGEARLAR